MDKHDINLNTGQVKFSNSMMGIFEDLKTNEVDPDVEPEVIVDKIGLMHEILNDLLDNVFIDSEKSSKINNVFKSNKVFTCDVCGKLLKSKQNLKYHVEVVNSYTLSKSCHQVFGRITLDFSMEYDKIYIK